VRRLQAVPLRVTLVAALVLMAALGLVASGVAVKSVFERSLLQRTDQQLDEAVHTWAKPRMNRPPPVRAPGPDNPPTDFYVRMENANGQLILTSSRTDAVPDFPASIGNSPVTIGSQGDSDVEWRALKTTTSDGKTEIAINLGENQETVDRLVALQSGIGLVVLSVLGFAAYFVIRRSLRPLVEVEGTAAAIAAGDLQRRVPVRGNKTEIDRLSMALNGMLAQIQRAFAASEASEEAAKRSEQKMRRFVADASHELRTPLTTIRGFAELYRQGAATDVPTVLKRIEGEASRMGLLVEDLLMLARLDAQRPLERKPVDLLGLASDAVHGARAVAPERKVDLDVVDGPGTMEVLGDEARLRQVLSNLVGNALTHTPPDANVTIRLSTTAENVLLQVIDTGPGLPEQDAAKVFERFYRTDTSRTRESGGTGLGLSIVSAIVASHDGTVTVESAPGKGSTFTVALPHQSGTVSP
jgi:two-component system, OmpR family, sensor kinase